MSDTQSTITRRHFLATAAAAAVAAPLLPKLSGGANPAFAVGDLHFDTALNAAAAIRNKEISSVELTKQIFDRIDRLNGPINAVVTLTRESAIKTAAFADAAMAKGENFGALHGVPITIKDTFEMEGVRTTAGAAFLSKYKGQRDAVGVTRLKNSGAVVVGKTNVPFMAGDVQTYNEVFGVTNNPWNLERTSGGSTGGGAAALAAGLSYLSYGSDIGGSIRTPSNFCGVYGHKPTIELVPQIGHIPPPPGVTGTPSPLAVAGPLARSADDLKAALQILGGPAGEKAVAYRWEMPPPRHDALKDFTVGYVLDDPFCPVVPETKVVLEQALEALDQAGATLVEGWPKGVDPTRQLEDYMYMLFAVLDAAAPKELLERTKELAAQGDWLSKIRQRANEDPIKMFGMALSKQQGNRQTWQAYFEEVDVFLSPVTFTAAIPHDNETELATRTLHTTLGDRSYIDLLSWIAHATYTGCPATSMPAGLSSEGLPIGLQIMGPFLEDATPIQVAGELSKLVGGYQPPPDFA